MHITFRDQTIDLNALLAEILDKQRAGVYHPWFYTYCGKLTSPSQVDRYVRLRRATWRTAGVEIAGKRILDAGGGFGINALLMALLGAAEVHNVDIHRGMISTCRAYLGMLPFSVPVYPLLADAAYLPYESQSFDVVISIEAISHYHEVDCFLAEAARVLRPGGTLVISDTNNGRNVFVRRETRAVWQLFENGPAGSLPFHKVERPFILKRRDIAERNFPALSGSELDMLAKGTSGLWGAELLAAFRAYAEHGVAPQRFYRGGSPIDPLNGVYIEQLFDPLQLGRDLERHGLKASVHSYFGGARGGALALANRALSAQALSPLALSLARGFIIAGKKA
jgi:2-polyprenyl-3-methyl-5-hydroxy-6-metoxy-1,4-benzoquinol methylase